MCLRVSVHDGVRAQKIEELLQSIGGFYTEINIRACVQEIDNDE